MWPKYYANQIIIPNVDGDIGIIGGWSEKEKILENLNQESKKRIGAIGQLYSKEGVNYIIRNLFLNPKIKTLIVTGQDLSGSLEFIKKLLLNKEGKEIIHQEIPDEQIKLFLNWFSQNSFFIEEKEINNFISSLPLKQSDWIKEAQNFPDKEIRESVDFPSEEAGFRLEDKKIANLWLKVLDRIIKFGNNKMSQYSEMQRELINLTTVINDEDPDDPYLPDFLYFNKEDLQKYYPQLMTDKIFEEVEYTYGSRLRNFNGINQVESIIKQLKKESYTRRAVAVLWNVQKDCLNSQSPCLNLIQALIQNDKVYLTVYFRSNDMYRAWPQNAFALRKIQKEIADATGFKMGKLCIISNSAHIYERDFLKTAEIIEKYQSNIECIPDPRGNFEIKVENDKIVVIHYSPDGQPLQKFTGQTATELQNQIFRYISDTLHALDTGQELMKAEIALKKSLKYRQDNNLEL